MLVFGVRKLYTVTTYKVAMIKTHWNAELHCLPALNPQCYLTLNKGDRQGGG